MDRYFLLKWKIIGEAMMISMIDYFSASHFAKQCRHREPVRQRSHHRRL